MRKLLLSLAVAVVCLPGLATGAKEPPLLGASLTWAVHRDFRSGTPGTRKVTFDLKSAWRYGTDFGSSFSQWVGGNPRHTPGEQVGKTEPFTLTNGIKAYGLRFGALCFWSCFNEGCTLKRNVPECVDNNFEVQTHNTDKAFTAGNFSYTLDVPADVVGILAYLSFKRDAPTNTDLPQLEPLSLSTRYMSTNNGVPLPTGEKDDRDWSALLPKASGATVKEGSWEKCDSPISPPKYCTAAVDCSGLSETCGSASAYGGYEYFGDTFLAGFQAAGDFFGLVPTFLQLCCSSCQSDRAPSAGCAVLKTRVTNYYSPVPSFPLALFQGQTNGPYDVRLKVSDYDGHMLRLLPIRAQSPEHKVASIEGRLKFHDYSPAAGPAVTLQAPSLPAVLTDIIMPAARQVLEVQDYVWPSDGIEDSFPTIGAKQTAASTLGVDPGDNKPSATGGGGTSQVVFSTFFQSAESRACPTARIPTWKAGMPTEIDCLHDKSPCFAPLEATTQTRASSISIEEAPGFERLKRDKTCTDFSGLPSGRPDGITSWDFAPVDGLCGQYDEVAPCGCCQHRSRCPSGTVCPDYILKEKKCRYNAYNYDISNVGEQRVMCFVAKATFCNAINSESEELCISGRTSCYSQPFCVRFNIVGRKPTFVDPTPLELNSRDALGRIVAGRTDVPACLGNPLKLSIKAVDEDSNDEIRIFVDDELRPTSFFSTEAGMYDSICGKFEPFAGLRVGVNKNQQSIVHLLNAEFDSTITSKLNPTISWMKSNATQSIFYTLDLDAKNGIQTLVGNHRDCGSLQTCRQRLLNMNRVICGYAYDNSRSRYAKWVGQRAKSETARGFKDYTDDHSLGSYATARHCWRIKLQAPPVFITNGTGCVSNQGNTVKSTCTPFGHDPGTTTDTTNLERAYANITLSVLQTLDVQFVAYDPNPEDRVQLFVMEDPGIPPKMNVGRSICVPRTATPGDQTCSNQKSCGAGEAACECGLTSKCNPGADEASGEGAKCRFCDGTKCNTNVLQNCPTCDATTEKNCECTGFCPSDLDCNHASMRLKWQPDADDFGKSFKVCVVARDNSDLCEGMGIQGTTDRGWYGEQQCMYLQVVPPAFSFQGPWIENFVTGTSKEEPYGIYVGCTFSIDLIIQETSEGASYGGKIIRSNALSQAPPDAMEIATNWKGEKKMEVVVTQAAICTDTAETECRAKIEVTPRLGSEGFYFQLCFSAGDQLGMVLNAGICIQDPLLRPCNLDSDCTVGTCLPLCFDLRVEKCRYCIKDGPETLRSVMDQYMIDTNWMRVWTLNADTFSALGTECPTYFDCDQGTAGVVAIDNPELIIKGNGKRILWTGVLYNPVESENAAEIACRFRTALRSMRHNNPDMAIGNGSLVFQSGDSVCLSACDAGLLLEQHAIPACNGIE